MTRPDLAWSYSELSKYVQFPGIAHMDAAEHDLQYLREILQYLREINMYNFLVSHIWTLQNTFCNISVRYCSISVRYGDIADRVLQRPYVRYQEIGHIC